MAERIYLPPQNSPKSPGKTADPKQNGLQNAVSGNLSQVLGNRAAQRMSNESDAGRPALPSFIQAKLTVTAAGDKYEQEADQVAKDVVQQMNQPVQREGMEEEELQMQRDGIQRQDMPEEEELQMQRSFLQREDMPEEEELQMQRSFLQREDMPEEEELQMQRDTIQREDMEEEELMMKRDAIQREDMPEEEELMMKRDAIQREGMEEEELQLQRDFSNGGEVQADVESGIEQARGGGNSLDDNVRAPLENAFGADFSGVRVHTDSNSDALNQSVQAKAFTTGQDIFFRDGAYDPASSGGKELLAHELTHVMQQNGPDVQRREDQKP